MKGKNEQQWKKVNQTKYDISFVKRVSKTFLEVFVVVQNNSTEMYKKSVLQVQSFFFAY